MTTSKFSYFKAPIKNLQPYRQVTLVDVYKVITGGYFKIRTEKLRSIKNGDKAKEYKSTAFDYVTFSGIFRKRGMDGFESHSGLIVFDFDHLGKDLVTVKNALMTDPCLETELIFTSPGGDGLKWIIHIDLKSGSHAQWFRSVSNYLLATYGLEPDKSGSDISRACFLPYDPQCYIHSKYLQK
jgi:hypothetical protein